VNGIAFETTALLLPSAANSGWNLSETANPVTNLRPAASTY
jgi:hypothetical protein